MTAIAGVVSDRGASFTKKLTEKSLQEQRLYGPEDPKLANIADATFGVAPWHGRRAAPFVAAGRFILVADVRLDNRDELLERTDQSKSISDIELLSAAWLKGGETLLDWVCGDFALAIFDAERRTLFLARDPTGKMPLHYATKGRDHAFASMPSGLRNFIGRFEVDRDTLAASACGIRDDDPRSDFKDIWRVMPGEVVRLSSEKLDRRIYWTPPTAYEEPLKPANLVEEYRHLLDQAVASSIEDCSAPIATHLSSGYDSSAVTATAARLIGDPKKIVAYTSAPEGSAPVPARNWRIGDESAIAAETASQLHVRHSIVRDAPPLREVMRHEFRLMQEPNISVPNLAWLLQIRREAAAAGAHCLLSGDSGNVSLNVGGLYVLAEWLHKGRILTWTKQAWHAAHRPDTHWRGVMFLSFLPWIPRKVAEAISRRYLGAAPTDEDSFLRPEWRARAIELAPRPPRHRNGYRDRIHLILNGNVGMYRKAGLAGEGVDERDPFGHRRLLEFSLRLPPESLYYNGISRPLARAALADRLPRSVIDLKFRGLQGADWAGRFSKADARSMLEEISASETARYLFDLDKMAKAIDRWPLDDWNQRHLHGLYRRCLMSAFAGAMFALVHEEQSTAPV